MIRCIALAVLLLSQDDVDALIKRLGREKPEDRDAASQELVRRGAAAREALTRAAKSGDPEVAARVRKILDDIEHHLDMATEVFARLAVEEKNSPQRFLWRAQTWLEKSLPRTTWDEILVSFDRQKFGVDAVRDGFGGRSTRFVAKPYALTTPQGQKIDLLLEFQTLKEPVLDARTKTQIRSASILLRAPLRKPHVQVLQEPRFPADSAFQKALAGASGYADVEDVEMTFGPLSRSRPGENYPSGFRVRVTFADRLEGKTDSAYCDLQVPSGLEPLRTAEGEKADAPQDVIQAPIQDGRGSKTILGLGLKRLDLPVPYDFSTDGVPEREIVPEAWTRADLDALPDSLRALRLVGDSVTEDLVKAVSRFRSLETLQFRDGHLDRDSRPLKVTDGMLRSVTELHGLRRLEIGDAGLVTDDGMRGLGALKGLVEIKIRFGSQISDEGARALSALDALESLEWDAPIGDAGLAALGKLPKLRSLRLRDVKGATPAGWATLSKAPALRELNVWACGVDDGGVAELAKLKDLEFLMILNQNEKEGNITDEGLLKLQSLTNLRRLVIVYTKATPEGLQALQKLLPGRFVSH